MANDIKSVLDDYKRWVESIKKYSEDKVDETIAAISTITNSKYNADGSDQKVKLIGSATNYKSNSSKNIIDGYVVANNSKELIYLEFGTRQKNTDTLRIRTDFKSEIDTNSIAAPYKVTVPFHHNTPISGRYYFLETIDKEGLGFIKTFGK